LIAGQAEDEDEEDDDEDIDRQEQLMVKESATQTADLRAEVIKVKDLPTQDLVQSKSNESPEDASIYDNGDDKESKEEEESDGTFIP
jgi:hypothetical protein